MLHSRMMPISSMPSLATNALRQLEGLIMPPPPSVCPCTTRNRHRQPLSPLLKFHLLRKPPRRRSSKFRKFRLWRKPHRRRSSKFRRWRKQLQKLLGLLRFSYRLRVFFRAPEQVTTRLWIGSARNYPQRT